MWGWGEVHNGDSTFEVLLCAWGYCGDEVRHFFVLKCRWGFNFCYFLVLFGIFVLGGTIRYSADEVMQVFLLWCRWGFNFWGSFGYFWGTFWYLGGTTRHCGDEVEQVFCSGADGALTALSLTIWPKVDTTLLIAGKLLLRLQPNNSNILQMRRHYSCWASN